MKIMWIGIAGFAGTVSRYAVDGWIGARTKGSFPWGTFVVNISGCFLVGLLTAVLAERLLPDSALRATVTIGFLGAYTTFSAFALQTTRLGENGALSLASLYLVASVVVGILAVIAGTGVGRALSVRP